jgi:plastocyanin
MVRVLAVVAATAVLLAACGGTASPVSVPSPSSSAAAGDTVAAQGLKFVPTTLEVPVGTTVKWTNKDTTNHTVTSGTPSKKDGKFDGSLAASTGTFSFTFTTAGTFQYFCTRHPTTMQATIVVK